MTRPSFRTPSRTRLDPRPLRPAAGPRLVRDLEHGGAVTTLWGWYLGPDGMPQDALVGPFLNLRPVHKIAGLHGENPHAEATPQPQPAEALPPTAGLYQEG